MDWVEITVHTTTMGADMVSEMLMSEGANGTMVEDRADIPDPDKPNGYWEIIDPDLVNTLPSDVEVHAWFEPDATLMEKLNMLHARLEDTKTYADFDVGTLEVEQKNVRDEDWAEVWKQFYKPFKAGKHLVVKPTWEKYDADEGDKIIEIDPGMAFGSGMHETTSMCLQFIEENVKSGQRVIDVGTGSGILAIGAALEGAESVLAIDIDPDAVRVAKENIAHNGLTGVIEAKEGNLLSSSEGKCELCVANIIADVICMFAEPLKEHIVPGGLFICSGIIKERENDVRKALEDADYTILEIRRKGEWVAMLSRRAQD